ncbi:MAG TPA: PQQ-dependent sugar dehydrogenase [Pyrinomonadaceae bacterium]
MAVSNDGTVYVSQRTPGTLSMLKDTNGDGVADVQKVVAEKKQMHGVFIDGSKIYLATVKEVFVADIKADGTLGELKMLIDDLPDGGQHPNRTLAVRGGKIWITVGSTCNACDETTPEAATILTTDLDGKNRQIYASGLRNTIGFGWHPVSGKLYGMDHGIDMLGDDDQEEELNEIRQGAKYGWAYVYSTGKLNPHNIVPKELGLTNADWARQSENPVLLYTPHAAPMQMVFYTGQMFPAEYKNDAFVAFRGSWNRTPPSGYELVRVRFDQSGKPTRFEPFMTGFLVRGGAPDGKDAHFARPVGLAQMKDGALLLTDDTNNIIYRIAYNQTPPPIMARARIYR